MPYSPSMSSRAIIGQFYHRLSELSGASWIDQLVARFQSNQESETYNWFGQVPQMREWVSGRLVKHLRTYGLTIVNKTWEATLEVDVNDLRRDKTGQMPVRISELARRALAHPRELINTLIVNGGGSTSGLAYDGQYFFDTDHSIGDSGAQTNVLTSSQVPALTVTTATAPTPAQAADAILGIIGYMLMYKDDQGKPVNEDAQSFLVMSGTPALWAAANQACTQINLPAGAGNSPNPLLGAGFKLRNILNPALSALTAQYVVFRTDGDVRPFIFQEELPLQMRAVAEGSELEFNEDKHRYGVKTTYNVGYGEPLHAAYATLST